MPRYDVLDHRLAPLRDRLTHHPLYSAVETIDHVRVFMRHHVFAVWDFMSLLKRLQQELTLSALPWRPYSDGSVVRFINEIVIAEESDLDRDDVPTSHFDLYRSAMRELDGETNTIDRFLHRLDSGEKWSRAIEQIDIPDSVRNFTRASLRWAESGTLPEVAAAFCFGREDIIPEMFQRLLPGLTSAGHQTETLGYYLERHIELDGDSHGPLAKQLLTTLCDQTPGGWEQAERAAVKALELRIELWDGVLSCLPFASFSGSVGGGLA